MWSAFVTLYNTMKHIFPEDTTLFEGDSLSFTYTLTDGGADEFRDFKIKRRPTMSKRNVEAGILEYFRTSTLDRVQVMFNLIKLEMKKRQPVKKPVIVKDKEEKASA